MPGLLRRLLELLAAGAVAEALALVEEEAVVRRRPAATPPPAAPAAAGHRLVRVASRESDQHDRYADSGEAVAVLDQLPVAWLRGTAAAARNEPIPRVGHDTGAGTPPHALQPPSSGRRQAARDNNISPNLTSPKPEPTASDEQAAEAVHAAQVLGFFMADYFRNHTQLMLVPRRLAAELAPAYHWLDEWRGRTVAHAAIKSAARAAADRGWTVARAAELLLLAGDYEPAVGFLVDVGAWPVAFEVAFALSSVVHAEWPHELLHELLQSLAANSAQQTATRRALYAAGRIAGVSGVLVEEMEQRLGQLMHLVREQPLLVPASFRLPAPPLYIHAEGGPPPRETGDVPETAFRAAFAGQVQAVQELMVHYGVLAPAVEDYVHQLLEAAPPDLQSSAARLLGICSSAPTIDAASLAGRDYIRIAEAATTAVRRLCGIYWMLYVRDRFNLALRTLETVEEDEEEDGEGTGRSTSAVFNLVRWLFRLMLFNVYDAEYLEALALEHIDELPLSEALLEFIVANACEVPFSDSGQDRIVATLRAVAERLPHMEDDAETAIRIMEGFRKQPFLYGLDDPARQITMQFLERDTSYVGHVESVLYALTSSELEWSDWDAEYRQPLLPEEDAFLARLRILHVWSTTSDIGGDDTLRHEPLSFVAILNAVWVLSHDNSMFQALTSEHGRLLDLYTPQTPARLPALQQSAGELLGLSALGTTAGSFAGSDGELPSGLHTLASPAPPQPLSPAAAAPAYETLPRLQLRTPEGTRLPVSPASQPPPSTQRTVATRARYQPESTMEMSAVTAPEQTTGSVYSPVTAPTMTMTMSGLGDALGDATGRFLATTELGETGGSLQYVGDDASLRSQPRSSTPTDEAAPAPPDLTLSSDHESDSDVLQPPPTVLPSPHKQPADAPGLAAPTSAAVVAATTTPQKPPSVPLMAGAAGGQIGGRPLEALSADELRHILRLQQQAVLALTTGFVPEGAAFASGAQARDAAIAGEGGEQVQEAGAGLRLFAPDDLLRGGLLPGVEVPAGLYSGVQLRRVPEPLSPTSASGRVGADSRALLSESSTASIDSIDHSDRPQLVQRILQMAEADPLSEPMRLCLPSVQEAVREQLAAAGVPVPAFGEGQPAMVMQPRLRLGPEYAYAPPAHVQSPPPDKGADTNADADASVPMLRLEGPPVGIATWGSKAPQHPELAFCRLIPPAQLGLAVTPIMPPAPTIAPATAPATEQTNIQAPLRLAARKRRHLALAQQQAGLSEYQPSPSARLWCAPPTSLPRESRAGRRGQQQQQQQNKPITVREEDLAAPSGPRRYRLEWREGPVDDSAELAGGEDTEPEEADGEKTDAGAGAHGHHSQPQSRRKEHGHCSECGAQQWVDGLPGLVKPTLNEAERELGRRVLPGRVPVRGMPPVAAAPVDSQRASRSGGASQRRPPPGEPSMTSTPLKTRGVALQPSPVWRVDVGGDSTLEADGREVADAPTPTPTATNTTAAIANAITTQPIASHIPPDVFCGLRFAGDGGRMFLNVVDLDASTSASADFSGIADFQAERGRDTAGGLWRVAVGSHGQEPVHGRSGLEALVDDGADDRDGEENSEGGGGRTPVARASVSFAGFPPGEPAMSPVLVREAPQAREVPDTRGSPQPSSSRPREARRDSGQANLRARLRGIDRQLESVEAAAEALEREFGGLSGASSMYTTLGMGASVDMFATTLEGTLQ